MTALDALDRLRAETPAWIPTLLALQASFKVSDMPDMQEERLG